MAAIADKRLVDFRRYSCAAKTGNTDSKIRGSNSNPGGGARPFAVALDGFVYYGRGRCDIQRLTNGF